MSKPKEFAINLISGARSEIMSAMSSLHMPPDPIPEEDLTDRRDYLSETDKNVAHSIEHLHRAMEFLGSVPYDVSKLMNVIPNNIAFDTAIAIMFEVIISVDLGNISPKEIESIHEFYELLRSVEDERTIH